MGIELVEGATSFATNTVLYMRSMAGQQRWTWSTGASTTTSWIRCTFGRLGRRLSGHRERGPGRQRHHRERDRQRCADDKLTYTYVPDLIEYYLGERPLLPNVTTYRLEDPEVREHCLARLDQLVVKPVEGSGGAGIVIGPQASDSELAGLRDGCWPSRGPGSRRTWCCCRPHRARR
jgi:hypothetical protein